MSRVVATGAQNFEELIVNNDFYVDKTMFIKEWWESRDVATLITRPRRFGKTLNMSMIECFWSLQYQGRSDLFEGLNIWKEKKYRELQGTYPVISLSFARVKGDNYEEAIYQICKILKKLYLHHRYLLDSPTLADEEKKSYKKLMGDMLAKDAVTSLYDLSDYLSRHHEKKVIILLDEYDTLMQEAYVNGYWKELVSFTRNFFNSTFKTNPYMERAIMTGITRISKESMFSDLNNLKVVTTTSKIYAEYFGFTEEEVFAAMDEFGMTNKEEAKQWYDGFTFGNLTDIYNPWSITNMLDNRELNTYWADTSSNALLENLMRTGSPDIKMQFEQLLSGENLICRIDEEIIYSQLDTNENAVWSLLLASGYLNALEKHGRKYTLALTNYEVKQMFEIMVQDWFGMDPGNYNHFIRALLSGDLDAMNDYMGRVALSMFSFFDGTNKESQKGDPERFYHGFVLGLLVDLSDRYVVTSNRESGFGRYDVMIEPLNKEDNGIILEFKVHNPRKETDLEETVQAALDQIEEKKYEQVLLDHGVKQGNIRKYGFAFEGKKVLIG